MSLRIKKINNIKIIPVPKVGKGDSRPVKGIDLFDLYSNIFICSHRRSGKTFLIYNIIVHCCTKNTTLIFFVSTIHRDETWEAILKYCDKKGIPYIIHTSLYDEEFSDIDKLNEIVLHLKDKQEDKQEVKKGGNKSKDKLDVFSNNSPLISFGGNVQEANENTNEVDEIDNNKPSKSKWQVPEYFFIFDDISYQIKLSKSVTMLLKEARHIKSKVLISSQSWVDVPKDARENIDYLLLFKNVSEERLFEMYNECSITAIPFEQFLKIYKYATKEDYSFLYYDKQHFTFRKKFNEQILVNNISD